MRIEDGFTFLAGVAVGAVITQHIVLTAMSNIRRDERAKKAALINVDGSLKAAPSSVYDYYETFWAWVAYKLSSNKSLSIRNARLGRFLFILFWIICAVSAYIGLDFLTIVSTRG